MLKINLKNEALLLRKNAAKGDFNAVQAILERNKKRDANFFNVNSCSSNGNTALHWACAKAVEKNQGYSEKYSKIIKLLVQYGADHLIENRLGKRPFDFFLVEGSNNELVYSLQQGLSIKNSSYFALIQAMLEKECMKTIPLDELEGEVALTTSLYLIIDRLGLINFFPLESRQQETLTIFSLACGVSTEIVPLIMYFQHQNKKIHYIGVDIDSDMIEASKARYKDYDNVDFICADASNLDEINAITSVYSIDMGMLRNADFTEPPGRKDTFCKIVNRILPNVFKPNSPLLMTFQSKYELSVCTQKTELNRSFKKFRSGNFCDTGKFCYFPTEHENNIILTYPDRYSVILNFEKANEDQDQLSHAVQKLRM